MYHQPVLLKDCIDGLQIKKEGVYVDVTFGGGGHSREILKHLDENGKLIGFDQDLDAKSNLIIDSRFVFIRQNFRYLKNSLRSIGVGQVDGILADFGVSSHQFDVPERGFSIRFDSALDMRMNQESELNAKTVINSYSEENLTNILKNYGELSHAKIIAKTICKCRVEKSIESTGDLIKCVSTVIKKEALNKNLSQIFQAIRIEVNQELEVIKDFLSQASEILKTGGRIVIISYHSLEDRLVKNYLKTGNTDGKIEKDFYGNIKQHFKIITKKPIIPEPDELTNNPRSRSAKLRIAEKI